ncbi:MAG: hypothetical protein ABI651_04560, partial [Verrucomicrobiota bacterium]
MRRLLFVGLLVLWCSPALVESQNQPLPLGVARTSQSASAAFTNQDGQVSAVAPGELLIRFRSEVGPAKQEAILSAVSSRVKYFKRPARNNPRPQIQTGNLPA